MTAWKQSFPLIIVAIANTPRIVAVMDISDLRFPARVAVMSPRGRYGMDVISIVDNPEEAATTAVDGQHMPDGDPNGIPLRSVRIALNAVLHLANYPELYGRFPSAANRVLVRSRQPNGQLKRRELIPQTIRLRAPAVDDDRPSAINHLPDDLHQAGGNKRPHWRKGHWRHAPCGPGRLQRRHVFIKPILVHSDYIENSDETAISLYRD